MAKWADFLISGVWFSKHEDSTFVSYVMLHVDTEAEFDMGRKTSKEEVIKYLRSGKTAITITWDFSDRSWQKGAEVIVETIQGKEYLKTKRDASLKDNIDNLIPMWAFDI